MLLAASGYRPSSSDERFALEQTLWIRHGLPNMAKYPTTGMCDGELLEAFEATTRDQDIFCATAAKCGQTWLMALMYHLRSRGLDPDMGGKDSFASMPWLELPRDIGGSGKPFVRSERLAELAALPDPRIFKMHVLYEEIPRPSTSRSRVVTITRDPRDLPYSMYCHLQGMGQLTSEQEDFNVYFERWMDFGYIFKFVLSFWPHHAEPHVLWLRYEDLKADLGGQARRVCEFLGWDVTDADLARVLPLVSLSRMQEREDGQRRDAKNGPTWREGSRFFREGAVGKNRGRLSEEQEARIVARARSAFEPACFDFVMSLR